MKRAMVAPKIRPRKKGHAAGDPFECDALRIFIQAPSVGNAIKTSEFWIHMEQEPMVSGVHIVPPLLMNPVKDVMTGEYAPSEVYLQHCFSSEAWSELVSDQSNMHSAGYLLSLQKELEAAHRWSWNKEWNLVVDARVVSPEHGAAKRLIEMLQHLRGIPHDNMPDAILIASIDAASNPGACYGSSEMTRLSLPRVQTDPSKCVVYCTSMMEKSFRNVSEQFSLYAMLLSPRVTTKFRNCVWAAVDTAQAFRNVLIEFGKVPGAGALYAATPALFHDARQDVSEPYASWPKPMRVRMKARATRSAQASTHDEASSSSTRPSQLVSYETLSEFPLEDALVIDMWRKWGVSNRHAVTTFGYWCATVMKKPLLVIDAASSWSPGASSDIFEWPTALPEYGVHKVMFVTSELLADVVRREVDRLGLKKKGTYIHWFHSGRVSIRFCKKQLEAWRVSYTGVQSTELHFKLGQIKQEFVPPVAAWVKKIFKTLGIEEKDAQVIGLHVRGGDMVDVVTSCDKKSREHVAALQQAQVTDALDWLCNYPYIGVVFAATDTVKTREWLRAEFEKAGWQDYLFFMCTCETRSTHGRIQYDKKCCPHHGSSYVKAERGSLRQGTIQMFAYDVLFISKLPVKGLISWESTTVPELCRSVRGEAFQHEYTHGETTKFLKDVGKHAKHELVTCLAGNMDSIKAKPRIAMPWLNAPIEFEDQIAELKTRLSENTDLLNACIDRLQRQCQFATDNATAPEFHLSRLAEMLISVVDARGKSVADEARIWKSFQNQTRSTSRMAGFYTFFVREVLYPHSVRTGLKPWVLDRNSVKIQQAEFDPSGVDEPAEYDAIRPKTEIVSTLWDQVEQNVVRRWGRVHRSTLNQMQEDWAPEISV